ncbi:MAG: metal ABC transporter ATP-binding protein [Anaerolineae bacterium]|nr:metal ABC transporter ATP-binding protein [Anaerolineae bacterium]
MQRLQKQKTHSSNGTHSHPEQYALEVKGLAAGYAGERRTIENITFGMLPGERVALVGPNGAGKSTLFKAIAGLIPFTAGSISVFDRDCRSSHGYVGYVPQQNEIDWTFPVNVYDVVLMGRARRNRWLPWSRRTDHEHVQQILEQLSLTSIAQRQIGELSGGQKRRVFIARALAQETQVLLMDEPFNGVDTSAEQEIMNALDMLTAQKITILLSTHDMGKAARDFDRVALLKHTLLAYDTPENVMRPEVLRKAYGSAMTVFQNGDETIFISNEYGTEN